MLADYYRYLSEFKQDNEKDHAIVNAHDNYKEANKMAVQLDATNEIRLGLSLNYSVFYYEILQNPNIAVDKAQHAFDDAMANYDNLDEHSAEAVLPILQLLRDNLALWYSEVDNYGAAAADSDSLSES
mmetsp:Transcript_1200/g.836  ORF Transcript_1200/g.836 Transcript_1200/m.836 type:complete len:128 (+) Transcript_1200:428-811(+)